MLEVSIEAVTVSIKGVCGTGAAGKRAMGLGLNGGRRDTVSWSQQVAGRFVLTS